MESRADFIRKSILRVAGTSYLIEEGLSSIIQAAIPKHLEITTIEGYRFKRMSFLNNDLELYYIPNTHCQTDIDNDLDVVLKLIRTNRIQAFTDEGLEISPNFAYDPPHIKNIYPENLSELLISRNICVFGSQDYEAYKNALDNTVAYFKKSYVSLFLENGKYLLTKSESSPKLKSLVDNLIIRFGETYEQYRADVEEHEGTYGQISEEKAFYLLKEGREAPTFLSIKEAMNRGYHKIAVIYGRHHAENFISHFENMCNIYLGQENESYYCEPEDSNIPDSVKDVVINLKILSDYCQKVMDGIE
ncbi:hypothetical protein JXA85_08515 [Candidatus Woesearchaeota archaeon]|nr:hypothetical protein [Candidatus Woesearchaeota archaeon]